MSHFCVAVYFSILSSAVHHYYLLWINAENYLRVFNMEIIHRFILGPITLKRTFSGRELKVAFINLLVDGKIIHHCSFVVVYGATFAAILRIFHDFSVNFHVNCCYRFRYWHHRHRWLISSDAQYERQKMSWLILSQIESIIFIMVVSIACLTLNSHFCGVLEQLQKWNFTKCNSINYHLIIEASWNEGGSVNFELRGSNSQWSPFSTNFYINSIFLLVKVMDTNYSFTKMIFMFIFVAAIANTFFIFQKVAITNA